MSADAFVDLPLPELLGRFASREPVPGGGSAAAIAGALASSLGDMVGSLTAGKKGYEEHADEIEAIQQRAAGLARALVGLAAEDAQAYEGVRAAMALPKDTDEQKAARQAAMQTAFQQATAPPYAIARACLDVARLALRLLAVGNKNAASDAAVSVLLAVAGAEGALFNIAINLGAIKDEAFVTATKAEAAEVWTQAAALRDELWPAARAAGLDVPR